LIALIVPAFPFVRQSIIITPLLWFDFPAAQLKAGEISAKT